jgi:hypothetical protein
MDEAVAELQRRRARFGTNTPGRDWLPPGFSTNQNGTVLLFRHVATPCFETLRFLELAGECGLLPVIPEFAQDKFVAHNPLKRALARMGFQHGCNRHGQRLVEFVNVLDWSRQGRALGDLETLWGQNLIAFHRELLAQALNGGCHPFVFDCSSQHARAGNSVAYYRDFLRICMGDVILFEDFLLDEMELPFTRDVVLPAFDAMTAEFGLKPLIVRLTSAEDETSPHWYWYPGELKAFVQERLQRASGRNLQEKINALRGR